MSVKDRDCCGEYGGSLIEVLVGLGLFILMLWVSVIVLNNYARIERSINKEAGLLTLKLNNQGKLKGQDDAR